MILVFTRFQLGLRDNEVHYAGTIFICLITNLQPDRTMMIQLLLVYLINENYFSTGMVFVIQHGKESEKIFSCN